MRIRISGGETMKTLGKADYVTVNNLSNQKEPMSSSPLLSSVSSTSDSVIDPVKEEFDWVAVEREADVITDKTPELDEVEDAFSALQLLFNDDDDDDDEEEESEDKVLGSEFLDWIEPPLELCNARFVQPYMLDRLYDAFHLFQTDPSVQRMVMSLASDKAVWDAVMNNEVVRELITNAERSEEESCSAANCIRRLFERSAAIIIDAMERVTKYVTELFTVVPGDDTVVLASGAAPVMEKLQMTVLLTITVLLIVLVTRATRAR